MNKKIKELVTEELLDKQLNARNIIREIGMPDKTFGFDIPISHFLKLMYVHFTSQSYGSRVQNRLIKEYELLKVPSHMDKGDAINKQEKYGEIKISFKNYEGDFSFVQIRPYQKCDFYFLQAINPDENFKQYSFIITKKDIETVLTKFKATNCHGVSKNKKDKTQEELRFSVSFGTDEWKYLVDNYLFTDVKNKLHKL